MSSELRFSTRTLWAKIAPVKTKKRNIERVIFFILVISLFTELYCRHAKREYFFLLSTPQNGRGLFVEFTQRVFVCYSLIRSSATCPFRVAKWKNLDLKYVDLIVQVLAKRFILNHFFQITIGRKYKPTFGWPVRPFAWLSVKSPKSACCPAIKIATCWTFWRQGCD